MPSGHGRVLRALKAAFPGAHLTACGHRRDGVEFCARVLGATPIVSRENPAEIELEGPYDLIWCGSLLTHMDAARWPGFLDLLSLAPERFRAPRLLDPRPVRGRSWSSAARPFRGSRTAPAKPFWTASRARGSATPSTRRRNQGADRAPLIRRIALRRRAGSSSGSASSPGCWWSPTRSARGASGMSS